MPTMENYEGRTAVFLDGVLLSDAASLRATYKTNDNRVKTMVRGTAGFSAGSTDVDGTITMPPLRDGMRVDWLEVVLRRKTVRLEYEHAGRRRIAEGRITDYEHSASVDQTAEVTLTFAGAPVGSL